jgi:hypothetical protein
MRRTGKLYTLTLVSAALAVYSSVQIAMWHGNSSQWHLWVDIVPQGFGIASVITSTLIVRILTKLHYVVKLMFPRPSSRVLPKRMWQWLLGVSKGAPLLRGLTVSPVTYLFRTTGQVLGVSLSGTLLQTILLSKLRQRIHGPNAEEVIPSLSRAFVSADE